MPVASSDVWNVLYTVARYLFPLLSVSMVLLILFYILSESRLRREKIRSLPGSGTVGELIVLSGSKDLDINTWFPVPREGVLGSVRSCDLVIPCPGVHTKHLDFSWEDGLGLLISPRTGCEALINGAPVTCRTDASSVPLTHGSILQVGSAVLRLHLFAALDNTPVFTQPAGAETSVSSALSPSFKQVISPSVLLQGTPQVQSDRVLPLVDAPATGALPVQSGISVSPELPSVPDASSAAEAPAARTRRSDHWKEDLGE